MPARPPIGEAKPLPPRPWARWYSLKRWKLMRKAQLEREPFCAFCLAQGKTRPARVADHVKPHRGDAALFWRGKLQSLCDACHSRHKQHEEGDGFSDLIGPDGWPLDPRHPFLLASARAEAPPGQGPRVPLRAKKRRF